jgi:hypothetical protein
MKFKNCDLIVIRDSIITTINGVSGTCDNTFIKVSIPVFTIVKGEAGQVSNANVIQFNPALPQDTLLVGDVFEIYKSGSVITNGTVQQIRPLNSYEYC